MTTVLPLKPIRSLPGVGTAAIGGHVGAGDGRRLARGAAARHGAHHLAGRQRLAVFQVLVHGVQRAVQVHMQRHVAAVVAGQHGRQADEAVEVLRVGDLDVARVAHVAAVRLVLGEPGACSVVDGQQRVVAAGHDQRGLAVHTGVQAHLVHSGLDPVGHGLHRARQRQVAHRIAAGGQRAQAQRAVQLKRPAALT
jgi:hypothetical protein